MKKSLTIMFVTLLLLTTVVSVYAESITLPELPSNEYRYFIITRVVSSYAILFFDELTIDDSGTEYQILAMYSLDNNEWKYEERNYPIILSNTANIFFDSSGITNTGNTVTFEKPKVGYSDFSNVFDSMTDQINVSTVLGIIVLIVGFAVGLVFLWWGIRKVVSAIMAAFKKGKISL